MGHAPSHGPSKGKNSGGGGGGGVIKPVIETFAAAAIGILGMFFRK